MADEDLARAMTARYARAGGDPRELAQAIDALAGFEQAIRRYLDAQDAGIPAAHEPAGPSR